jgi:hypothetical protein
MGIIKLRERELLRSFSFSDYLGEFNRRNKMEGLKNPYWEIYTFSNRTKRSA